VYCFFSRGFKIEVGLTYPMLKWCLFLLADLPEGDPKLQIEKRRYAVGDTLRGNCSSPASSPPTNLTWIINGKRVSELNQYEN
jgi:hypothetical protein